MPQMPEAHTVRLLLSLPAKGATTLQSPPYIECQPGGRYIMRRNTDQDRPGIRNDHQLPAQGNHHPLERSHMPALSQLSATTLLTSAGKPCHYCDDPSGPIIPYDDDTTACEKCVEAACDECGVPYCDICDNPLLACITCDRWIPAGEEVFSAHGVHCSGRCVRAHSDVQRFRPAE